MRRNERPAEQGARGRGLSDAGRRVQGRDAAPGGRGHAARVRLRPRNVGEEQERGHGARRRGARLLDRLGDRDRGGRRVRSGSPTGEAAAGDGQRELRARVRRELPRAAPGADPEGIARRDPRRRARDGRHGRGDHEARRAARRRGRRRLLHHRAHLPRRPRAPRRARSARPDHLLILKRAPSWVDSWEVERLRPIARWRWPILLGVWLVNVPTHWTIHRGDWIYFVWGAKLLGLRGPGAGLQTLGAHPALATGPLSLVVTRFLQIGGTNGLARAQFLMWALGPAALVLLERAGRRSRPAGDRLAVDLTVLSGGAVLLQTWALAAGSAGHIDDVLTMSFAALAVWATAERRPGVLACAIALATAAKPWGLFLLPLTLAPQLRHPLRTAALALGVTALPWLPFALADHALISQHLYDHFVMPRSGLAALGMPQEMAPHWVRPAQVLGGV